MSSNVPSFYLHHLEEIAREDAAGLMEAEKSYGPSWKQRGGVGAFMMLARKWDRIVKRVEPNSSPTDANNVNDLIRDLAEYDPDGNMVSLPSTRRNFALIFERLLAACRAWDIFEAIRTDERAEGIIDDVRDLRRYLLLVEAEARALGYASAKSKHRDNPAATLGEGAPPSLTRPPPPDRYAAFKNPPEDPEPVF